MRLIDRDHREIRRNQGTSQARLDTADAKVPLRGAGRGPDRSAEHVVLPAACVPATRAVGAGLRVQAAVDA
jgi:hypothetical protein